MTGATVTTLKTQRNEKPGAEQGEMQRKKESVAGGGGGGQPLFSLALGTAILQE